jgi:hypothetical protein
VPVVTNLFALYQGTTLVVPPLGQNGQGFSPCHRKICTKFQSKKGLVGALCFSRGEQRFSVAEKSWISIMRSSAGLKNPGLKPVLSE